MSVPGKDAGGGGLSGLDHAARGNDDTMEPVSVAQRLDGAPGLADGAQLSGTGHEPPDLELRRIEVRRIAAYERRPRRAENPAYANLKAAVRRDGLTHPLAVTRRPGVPGYVLWGGGTTRLRILKELAAETGDARFATVPCLFRPWRGEADVLLAHLKENGLRGAVAFVDLAAAVVTVKTMLAREASTALDDRRCSRRLAALGYPIDHRTISLATYAAGHLSAVLPLAAHGLSRSDIESTRSLERGARALWRDWSIDAVEEYDSVFRTLCARYDGPDWALSDLHRALVEEMAVRGDRTAQAVALELQARLSRLGTGGR